MLVQCCMQQAAAARAVAALPPLPSRRSARRRLHLATHCSQQSAGPGSPSSLQHGQQERQDSLVLLGLRAVILATTAQAVAAVAAPQAAQAAGWRPRRHAANSLRSEYKNVETRKQAQARKAAEKQAQAAPAAAAQQQQQQGAATGLQGMLRQVQRKWQDARRERPVFAEGMSAPRAQTYSSGAAPQASPLGWVAVGAAVLAGALLAGGRNLQWPWGGRRVAGGRWVRDRSLGGKMIFIPDAEPLDPSAPRPMRPLYEDPDSDAVPAAAPAGAALGPWADASPAPPAAKQPFELPSWWDAPSSLVYTTASRREELEKQAKQTLRYLQDKKLEGMDYPVSALVELRTLCQEAGGYQVRPSTEAARDAMLRAGIRAAINSAVEGGSMLGGAKPARFVCGLAHDLGVPEERAVQLVQGMVASTCKEALIAAEAAFRAGDNGDVLMCLLRLAAALQAFPLPPGSAEAEMVAAGVVRQAPLDFRRAIFLEFGQVDSQMAALVAELLGFNPALVMPELQRQLGAAQAAGQAAAQAAEAAAQAGGALLEGAQQLAQQAQQQAQQQQDGEPA